MNAIMKFLFSSSMGYPGTWAEDSTLGDLSESVQQLRDQLRSVQPELWAAYQKQAEALNDLERQMEFERGFLMAAQLAAEVIGKVPEN